VVPVDATAENSTANQFGHPQQGRFSHVGMDKSKFELKAQSLRNLPAIKTAIGRLNYERRV
jgi:hypothetical protein